MEILFAAEESAIMGMEVELEDVGWSNQRSGSPVTRTTAGFEAVTINASSTSSFPCAEHRAFLASHFPP